ncbi:aminotransferase class V-fold PLP-dependent enzyme [Nitrospira sp. Nam80]
MLYFNHAGLSPAGPEVLRAMNTAADSFGTMLYSESGIAWYRKQVKDCGNRIAGLLHTDLDQDGHSVLLCPNATSSLRIILSLIGLQPGDVVITSDQEHLSTLQALSRLKQRGIAAHHIVQAATEEQFLSQLESACNTKPVALILLSHVTHSDGRIFPVEQVCQIARKRAIPVAIDGAQAVGHIPVHIGKLSADFYYFSGHKWCAGPMGSGALLIGEPFKKGRSNQPVDPLKGDDPDTSSLNLGTQNIGLIAGLGTACALRQQTWPMGRLAELHRLFSESLRRIRDVEIVGWNGAHAPGFLSFRVQRAGFSPAGIASYLSQRYEIVLKPVQYRDLPPLLRVSWSLATAPQDIVFLAEKLEEALERSTGPSSG